MSNFKNIDTSQVNQRVNNEDPNDEIPQLKINFLGLMNDMKLFFLVVKKKFEIIEKSLLAFVENNYSKKNSYIHQDLIQLMNLDSKQRERIMIPEEVQTREMIEKGKRKINQFFVLNLNPPDNIERDRRRFLKPFVIKVKTLKIYIKIIRFILKLDEKTGIKELDSSYSLFIDHTSRYPEELKDIIKVRCKNKKILGKLFNNNQVRIGNFKIFIEILFNQDIQTLINNYSISCCKKSIHSDLCELKWKLLRDWIFYLITRVYYE